MKYPMSEYIKIMMRLHLLIKRRHKGSKQDFVDYLGVNKRTFENMRLALISLGGDIEYNNVARCYEYKNDFEFSVGVQG